MSNHNLSKKRPASSQNGPAAKKANTSSSAAEKRRSQPVTRSFPIKEDTDSDEDGFEEVPLANEDITMEDSTHQPKDPNAAREAHKAQRILTDQRRAAKPNSALLVNAKRLWSLARQKTLPPAERRKHVAALMAVLRGKVAEVVFKHDASRIVQTAVKWGTQAERDEIAKELRGRYKELAQSKYSKFLVSKLIRLCPSHRSSILLEFQGSVLRLLLHREATTVLSDAFELYTNAYERSLLLRDFYGKETALFTMTVGSPEDKERVKKGLSGVLEGVDPERRKRVMGAVKENLLTILNNSDKGAVTHAIVHRGIWEYLQAVNELPDEVEQEKLRREMFENCQEILAEMVHTRDGSRVVREFIAQGSAKDRKHIVKILKPHVVRMCTDDEAQLVLFTALEVIDDTKLTGKSLVADITGAAPTLSTTPQGRRALFHLLTPRTPRHFPPALSVSLSSTDAIRAKTSKKVPEVRNDEIRKSASEKLVAFVEDDGAKVSLDPGGSLVIAEIMLFAEGSKIKASETLLSPLSAPYPSPDADSPHPIDLPHTSRLIKTLLQGGHFSKTTKSVVPSPAFSASTFSSAFLKVVGRNATIAMANGDGAFVVAELLERVINEGNDEDKNVLRDWFGESVKSGIEQGNAKGKKVLMEKIDVLSR